jgi:CRP/FNR family cyclic AMP-dependent transcriptional regulator
MVSADILAGLDIFSGLTEKELEAATAITDLVSYERGGVIFRENEEAVDLYVLLEGRVAIEFEVGHHQEAVVHIVREGQAFGWSALVQPYRFTATARCQQDCHVITVDRAGLRRLMDKDCYMGFVIMEKLAELISGRLRETRLQLISMIHG